jgi:hypothetical protein
MRGLVRKMPQRFFENSLPDGIHENPPSVACRKHPFVFLAAGLDEGSAFGERWKSTAFRRAFSAL